MIHNSQESVCWISAIMVVVILQPEIGWKLTKIVTILLKLMFVNH